MKGALCMPNKSNSLDMNIQYFANPNNDPNQTGNNTDQKPIDPSKGGDDTQSNNTQPQKNPQPELKYSDADVQKIVQETLAKADEKNKAATAAAVKEAEEKAKLSAQELKDYNMKKLKEEYEQLKAKSKRMELVNKARSYVMHNGINLSSGELNLAITDDEESTLKNIDILKGMQERMTKNAKDKLTKGHTPPTDLSTEPNSLVGKISKRLGGK